MLNWDLSLYRADIRGELLQYNPGEADVPAATFNAGRTRHEGIEAALEINPTAWLQLRPVYTYSNFRFRGDAVYGDNRLPVVPRHVRSEARRVGTACGRKCISGWSPYN